MFEFIGWFQAVVTCYIQSSSNTVSFYGKKCFQANSFQSVCESVFQSVQCFSHVHWRAGVKGSGMYLGNLFMLCGNHKDKQ